MDWLDMFNSFFLFIFILIVDISQSFILCFESASFLFSTRPLWFDLLYVVDSEGAEASVGFHLSADIVGETVAYRYTRIDLDARRRLIGLDWSKVGIYLLAEWRNIQIDDIAALSDIFDHWS